MTHFLSGEGADYTYIILTGFGQLCFRTSFWDNPFNLYIIFIIIRTGSWTLAQSEVEFSFIIVDGLRLFPFVIGSSMLDLAGFLDLPLFNIMLL